LCHLLPFQYSGGLQVEPAPDFGGLHASLEAFSVKVEPAPGCAATMRYTRFRTVLFSIGFL
jgi:hypothetical protein